MKRAFEIALECDVTYNQVRDAIKQIGIRPTREGRGILFDKYQEDLIHQHLYFTWKITEITLKSKINSFNSCTLNK